MDLAALEKMIAPFDERGCVATVYLTIGGAATLNLARVLIEQVTVRDPGPRASWYVQLREIGYDTADRGIHSVRADSAYLDNEDGTVWMRDSRTGEELQLSRPLPPGLWERWEAYRDGPGAASVADMDRRLDEWAARQPAAE
jgi:hypothetical protein